MAKGPIYRVPLRRRREGKTNYYKRRELLKSNSLRVIIRKSTKHMRVQFVEALPNGDTTLISASSIQLSEFNWTLTGGNIPAAYLTGYLAGKKAQKSGITNAILDMGLQRSTKGGRIYAALKGVIDSGIDLPVNESIFPSESVLQGSHIKTISDHIKKEDAKAHKKIYAKYQKAKVTPDKLSNLVKSTKGAIDKL